MASVCKLGFLSLKWRPTLHSVRYRRVNVQKPREPHYERAKVLALIRPIYPKPTEITLPSDSCQRKQEVEDSKYRPDNPFERILAKELLNWFDQSQMVAFLHANPISGEDKFQITVKLKKENMHLKVYSHHTVRMALKDTHYAPVLQLFQAHNAMVFSQEPQVAKFMKMIKRAPQLVLMAGIVEGRLLSVSQMKAYSQIKDLDSARAMLVSALNSAPSQLVSQLTQHQLRLVSLLDQYAQTKSEPGEPESK